MLYFSSHNQDNNNLSYFFDVMGESYGFGALTNYCNCLAIKRKLKQFMSEQGKRHTITCGGDRS